MPGKVKVRVVAGRGLPVMDRSADTTDAFAEVLLQLFFAQFRIPITKNERKCRQ